MKTTQDVMEARENQCEQGQCQTKHDWDGAGDGDDKNRAQMTNDERNDMNDSQALSGGDIKKYRALAARIRCLSQDRQHLKFCVIASMLCDGKPVSV